MLFRGLRLVSLLGLVNLTVLDDKAFADSSGANSCPKKLVEITDNNEGDCQFMPLASPTASPSATPTFSSNSSRALTPFNKQLKTITE